ncbi:MAG TPA: VWA domain-containing protein [Vicinamibacterales bacterium]|jgi:VWFA-related protein|nr:VWA domain-containing protein [Vicinamibacterales bacterium]
MNVAWLPVVLVLAAAPLAARALQAPVVRITHPLPDTIVSGASRVDVAIDPPSSVTAVTITVNGRILCTVERPPFSCGWDPGPLVRGHHIRVVASFAEGRDVVANVRTKDVGVTERARVDAVLVPVIVTDDGEFVRGLKKQDFEVFEDGVAQPIASVVSEEAPLDLVLAVDVSGSMERALDEVKLAVKQLLTKLRPGDAATLVGFNDNFFMVAEREKDPATREAAVDMLASWGGTALYDATVRVLDLVSREWGRKGVVIFSDGDDRNSLTTRETAMSRVQASDAMLYTIGFGGGATIPLLRASLEQYARATGGRPFFPQHIRDLDAVFGDIVTELANQYVLSYAPTDLKQDSRWRNIKVQVRKGKYDVRARRGYRPQLPHRAGAAESDIAMR